MSTNPGARDAWRSMFQWITDFVADRRRRPARGDVVDAVLAAEIEGRPITDDEIIGVVQLLILGGLETTAGALGQFMIRFCLEPEIPALLRAHPERIPDAVEEFMRLYGLVIMDGRYVAQDIDFHGCPMKEGDTVWLGL